MRRKPLLTRAIMQDLKRAPALLGEDTPAGAYLARLCAYTDSPLYQERRKKACASVAQSKRKARGAG